MNKTEQAFHDLWIAPAVKEGTIKKWWFEKWRFTLTEAANNGKPGIAYTPDFVVMLQDGELQAFEVKGHGNARRESLNRTKLFRDQTGIRTFVATQQSAQAGGGFTLREY